MPMADARPPFLAGVARRARPATPPLGVPMTHTPFTFLVVAEDGTSHAHHTRLRTGAVDELLRPAVGGRLEPVPIGTPDLSAWCDPAGPPTPRRPNPAAGLPLARLRAGPQPRA